jgi:phospholipase/lecithinase/hemolysin
MEVLEDRTLPTASWLTGAGAIGDSLTLPYFNRFGPNSHNWVEALADLRGINFGAQVSPTPNRPNSSSSSYANAWWGPNSYGGLNGAAPGLAAQISAAQVNLAAVELGVHDFLWYPMANSFPWEQGGNLSPSASGTVFSDIYNGTLSGSALQTYSNQVLGNLAGVLNTLSTAPGRADLVAFNIPDFSVVPVFSQLGFTDSAGLARYTNAVAAADAQYQTLASQDGIPLIDIYDFSHLVTSGNPVVVGGVSLDLTHLASPTNPTYFFADAQHPGTVVQGLIANMFIAAADNTYGADIAPLSDQEILRYAGLTPPTPGPTYFDVSRLVIYPTPALTSLSTTSAPEGSPDLTINLTGTNFLSSSVVQWNGAPLPTTFVSGSALKARVPAADLVADGVSQISVVNPTPGGGPSAARSFTVTEVSPTVGAITAPLSPNAVNVAISASASFTDASPLDTHTAVWNWGDNTTSAGTVTAASGSGSVSGSHTYTTDGVFTVTLTVNDNDGASAQSVFQYVVVYDPSAGFVTGAGSFTALAGAYTANPALTGQANFGFDVKYLKGSTVPTGSFQFDFPAANLSFQSTNYEWLVINGSVAQFRGAGTINGAGNYGFLVTVYDGGQGQSKIRIKIWDKNNANAVIFDTQPGAVDTDLATTLLDGGNIKVHSH